MGLREKKARRFQVFIAAIFLCAAGLCAAYFVRIRYIETRVLRDKNEGYALLSQKDYFSALSKIGPYLSRHPNDVDAVFKYAQARENVEEPDGKHLAEAIALYRRVLNLQPENSEAAHALLNVYGRVGFDTETISVADSILSKQPKDHDALRAKSISLARLRRFDEAMKVASALCDDAPLDLEGHILVLTIMVKAQQPPEKILARCNALRAAHPGDARFDLLQSIAYSLQGNAKAAEESINRAVAAPVNDTTFTLVLASQLDSLKLYDKSFAALQQAVVTNNDPKIVRSYVARLWERKSYDQLLAIGKNARGSQDSSSDAEVTAFQILGLMSLNRSAEADKLLANLTARKNDVLASAWSAVLHTSPLATKPDDHKILDTCDAAVKETTDTAVLQFFSGQAFERAGDHESALQRWKLAATEAPSWAEPLSQMARTLLSVGRAGDAYQAVNEARLRAPQDINAMVSQALVWSATLGSQQSGPANDLLALIDDIQKRSPGEETTLPLQLSMLARTGKKDEAMAKAKAILVQQNPPPTAVLLQLASVSRQAHLGLEKDFFNKSEKAFGMSPDLAFARAKLELDNGDAKAGLALLERAKPQAPARDSMWDVAWARYLDMINDPRALTEWTATAENHADDSKIQWLALSAQAVQTDRALIAKILDRLGSQIGERGLTWRLARAQYLLDGKPGSRETVEATLILNEVSRSAPDLLAPRLLLADCLEKLGNIAGAIEQLSVAANLRPDSNPIALELARLLQARGDFEQSRVYLDRVIKNNGASVDERRFAASLLAQNGDIDGALKLLKSLYSDDAPPDRVLAVLYRQRNQLDKVDAISKKLVETKDPVSIGFAADFYASQGRTQDAQAALARLDKVDAEPGLKELIRAEYYQRYGTQQQADAEFEKATVAAPTSPRAWQKRCVYCLSTGRTDQAFQIANQAVKSIPGNIPFEAFTHQESLTKAIADQAVTRELLAWLLQTPTQESEVTEAIKILASIGVDQPLSSVSLQLRTLADRNPRILPIQKLAVQSYYSAGDTAGGIAVATRAMRTFPNDPVPAQLAAVGLAGVGRWTEAQAAGESWRQRSLSDAMMPDLFLASADVRQGHPDSAMQRLDPYLSKAVASPNQLGDVLAAYAVAQTSAREADAARKLLRPALGSSTQLRLAVLQIAESSPWESAVKWMDELQPYLASAPIEEQLAAAHTWLKIADLSNRAEDRQMGMSLLDGAKRAVEKNPPAAKTYTSLGMVEEKAGDLNAAEIAYRKATELDPKASVPENNLAMLLVRQNKLLPEAVKFAAFAVKNCDAANEANFNETLALAQSKSGQHLEAAATMKKALHLKPYQVDWRVTLVQIFLDGGEIAQAKDALEEVLKASSDRDRMSPESRDQMIQLQGKLGVGSNSNLSPVKTNS